MTFGNNWFSYTLLTDLPTYINDILRSSSTGVRLQHSLSIIICRYCAYNNTTQSSFVVDVCVQDGVQSAYPYLFQLITLPLGGALVDYVRKEYKFRTISGK
jgi:hypothetical protein